MFSVHATKKLLDRAKAPVQAPVTEPSTVLGNWYANVLFWKPQVALFVNERTLYPVLMPLAPAATLFERFPPALAEVLTAAGIGRDFVEAEVAEMGEARYARTANRSVLGIMNEFKFLAEIYRESVGPEDLVTLAMWLAATPCKPLSSRHGFPDRELVAAVNSWRAGGGVEPGRR